jgi:hypothetical protein
VAAPSGHPSRWLSNARGKPGPFLREVEVIHLTPAGQQTRPACPGQQRASRARVLGANAVRLFSPLGGTGQLVRLALGPALRLSPSSCPALPTCRPPCVGNWNLGCLGRNREQARGALVGHLPPFLMTCVPFGSLLRTGTEETSGYWAGRLGLKLRRWQ